MSLPINRSAKATLDANLVNGITSDAPALKASDDVVYNTIDELYNYALSLVTSGTLSPLPPDFLYRQAIINGNFDVWQRGTSFGIVNLYTADRWLIGIIATTAPGTTSRQSFATGQTQVPDNPKYFMRVNPTGFTGCSYFVLEQPIEGVETFSGGKVTLSFWANANSAQTIIVQLIQNFGTGGSPSSAVVIDSIEKSVGTTWAKYSVTFVVPSISGKTVGTNGDSHLRVVLNLPKSGTYYVDIAQVQLCAGEVALPFQPRNFADELAMCQRYYEKSYSYNTVPATASSLGGIETKVVPSNTIATNQNYGKISYKVKKRTNPTVTIYPYTTPSNTGRVSTSAGLDLGANTGTTQQSNDDGFTVYNSGASDTTASNSVIFHFSSDAEL